jgi:predicted GNAT family acetyltransferase
MDDTAFEVVHLPEKRRYEIRDDGKAVGAAHYRREPGRVVFTHTKVSDAYAGQGLGALLVKAAVDDVRASGQRIVPVCPFVGAFLRRHREYDDVVDPPPAPPGTTAAVAGSAGSAG